MTFLKLAVASAGAAFFFSGCGEVKPVEPGNMLAASDVDEDENAPPMKRKRSSPRKFSSARTSSYLL